MERLVFIYFYVKEIFRKVIWHLGVGIDYRDKKKYYCGKKFLSGEEVNSFIYKRIQGDSPFLVSRLGSIELEYAINNIGVEMGILKSVHDKLVNTIKNNAGFYETKSTDGKNFAKIYLRGTEKVDILACHCRYGEDYAISRYGNQELKVCRLWKIEPYYYNLPWTAALKGKKVLLIHPYSKSIEKQYQNRERLFENPNMLPQFELVTVQAVQSVGGASQEYASWFCALDYMYEEAMKKDFEVAIVGCGAYGLPLAARLKEAGKKVIHLGGATQIIFGIKGKRWDQHPKVSGMYNEYWTRPMEAEKPSNAESIESGCYW